MSLEFKTVYVDMSEKRKYWVYSEKDKRYYWEQPSSSCTGSEAVNKFKQYHDTLTQCSIEKLRKIADVMGFYITEYIYEEIVYAYRPNDRTEWENYYYPICRSIQGSFTEMPDVVFKIYDTQYSITSWWVDEYEGVNMYVLTDNGFIKCFHFSAFFGNFYDRSGNGIYRDTCFKTSFFKIVDVVGGVHIITINNDDRSAKYDCHIVNLFDTTTHDWVGYGVTMDGYIKPINNSDKSLETQDDYPVLYRETGSVGTQKFITKMKDNEAWYSDVSGADTTYRVGTGVRLKTPNGNPANTPLISGRYYITTLSNGVKIFSISNSYRNPIVFKD